MFSCSSFLLRILHTLSNIYIGYTLSFCLLTASYFPCKTRETRPSACPSHSTYSTRTRTRTFTFVSLRPELPPRAGFPLPHHTNIPNAPPPFPGMPSAYAADLPSSMAEVAQNKAQQHGVVVGAATGKKTKKDPALCPTDHEAVMPERKAPTRSWDYVWRSGVAGGLAGCAVSFFPSQLSSQHAPAGKDIRRNRQLLTFCPHRPKPSSRPLTASRSSSRRATRSLQNIQAPRLASSPP